MDCAPLSPEVSKYFDTWLDSFVEKVKNETGFDFKNHTQEEWNAYYLSVAEKQAESDEYFREILKSARRTIDEKDYSGLVAIHKNYDQLVKEQYDRCAEKEGIKSDRKWKDLELPYWCYSLCNTSRSWKTKGE